MNLGLSDLQKSKFPNYNPVAQPIISSIEIPNSYIKVGFANGEGCFFLSIFKSKSKSNKNKISHAVQLIFKLTQHKRDKELLELIANFLNCGTVYFYSENAFVFKVTNFANIIKIIILMFKVNPIQGIKQWDYQDFCKVAALIDEGKHLTHKGLAKILLIKNSMNTKRKFPKI